MYLSSNYVGNYFSNWFGEELPVVQQVQADCSYRYNINYYSISDLQCRYSVGVDNTSVIVDIPVRFGVVDFTKYATTQIESFTTRRYQRRKRKPLK